jgi:hypothetical protein
MHTRSNLIFSWTIVIAIGVAAAYFPALRHGLLYNSFPLCCIGFVVIFCARFQRYCSYGRIVMAMTLVAVCFNAYNYLHYGVRMEFDSKEYYSLAQGIASGRGMGHTAYRTPLYPALVGVFMLVGDHRGLCIVLFQHLLVALCVPGVFVAARTFGLSPRASCIAAVFIALNSLLAQSAGLIMTEILFCVLSLLSIALLVRTIQSPSVRLSIYTGAAFAAATYCRPMLAPVLTGGLVLLWIKKGKRGVVMALLCLGVYCAALAPWCLRNYVSFGHYTMSASLGVQAFTKAFTFQCLNEQGPSYTRIKPMLSNCIQDLGISPEPVPKIPENDWRINRVPHALMDSLTVRHGYSYFAASDLLGKTAIEGMSAHPWRWALSIGQSFSTLAFSHRELFPDAGQLVPSAIIEKSPLLRRIANGLVYVSGYMLLLLPLAVFIRSDKNRAVLIPFAIVCGMYALTAAVQIGFTRYTLPWEPLKMLCAAYVVESVVIGLRMNVIPHPRSE